MKIVTVDNDRARLKTIGVLVRTVFPDCTVMGFTDPLMASKYVYENEVDMVLTEQKMRPADGLKLVFVLRQYKPKLPIIMLAGTDAYREQAARQRVDEYFVRPITAEQMETLRAYEKGGDCA